MWIDSGLWNQSHNYLDATLQAASTWGRDYLRQLPTKIADYTVFTVLMSGVLVFAGRFGTRAIRRQIASQLSDVHRGFVCSLRDQINAILVLKDGNAYKTARTSAQIYFQALDRPKFDAARFLDKKGADALAEYTNSAERLMEALNINVQATDMNGGQFALGRLDRLTRRMSDVFWRGQTPALDLSGKLAETLRGLGVRWWLKSKTSHRVAAEVDQKALELRTAIEVVTGDSHPPHANMVQGEAPPDLAGVGDDATLTPPKERVGLDQAHQ